MESQPLPSAPPEDMEDDLECPVCFLVFSQPKRLKCGHSFCSACLRHILEHTDPSYCPLCRAVIVPRVVEELDADEELEARLTVIRPSAPPEDEGQEDLGLPAAPSSSDSTDTSFTKHKQPGFFGKLSNFLRSDPVPQLSEEQRADGMCWGATFSVEESEVPAIVKEWISTLWLLPGDLTPENVVISGVPERLWLPFHAFHVSTNTRYAGRATIRKKKGGRARDLELPGGRLESSYYHLVLGSAVASEAVRTLAEETHIRGEDLQLLPPVVEAAQIISADSLYRSKVEPLVENAEERRALTALRQRCGVRANVLTAAITAIDVNAHYDASLACVPFFLATFQYGGSSYAVLINGVTGLAVGQRPYGGGAFSKLAKYAYEGVRSVGQWLGLVEGAPSASNNNNE